MTTPVSSIFDYMDKVEDAPIEMPSVSIKPIGIKYDDNGKKILIYPKGTK